MLRSLINDPQWGSLPKEKKQNTVNECIYCYRTDTLFNVRYRQPYAEPGRTNTSYQQDE